MLGYSSSLTGSPMLGPSLPRTVLEHQRLQLQRQPSYPTYVQSKGKTFPFKLDWGNPRASYWKVVHCTNVRSTLPFTLDYVHLNVLALRM